MRRVVPRLPAIALALLLPMLPTAGRAEGTRVTGQVVDAESLQPVAGADVELQNAGGGPGYHRTRTDAKGEFAFAGVATRRYYVFTVGAEGYTDWALESWQFPAAQREVRIVVPLDKAGRLAVRLTGADGRTPVAGARVNVRSERAAAWNDGGNRNPDPRWSNGSGEVAFEGLRAGAWTVSVEASGLRSDEARGVSVRPGETTPLALQLTRPASLSGSVRLADSTGIAGVTVIARGPGEATATTDAGGFFVLQDLAPGRYRVEVSHDGLEPGVARDGLVLREGESREIPALRVTPRPVSLAFVLQREVFSPVDKQQVGLRSFRVGAVDLTLWRMPEQWLPDPSRDFRTRYLQGADTTGLVRVTAWRHVVPDGPPFAWREENVALPFEQQAGVYVLEARAGGLVRRVLFFVSDLGLVVKRSPTHTLVWAGSLRTGLPLEGVTVIPVDVGANDPGVQGGQNWTATLARARAIGRVTDRDGLLSLPSGTDPARLRIVAIADGHGAAVAEPPLAGAARQGGDQVFLFTERPIYRPGQALDWKLFAREWRADGYHVPAGGDVTLTLRGPSDESIDLPAATLSATGAADGVAQIPADVSLGEWSLGASWGHTQASAAVAIEQYRKPEYKVDVTPEREVVVNGDEVRFRVAAGYFFGAPVVGAAVRYTLFESRIRGEDLWEAEGGEEGGDGGEGGGYGRTLESGETRTDIDGRVSIAFNPARVAYDRRLALEVEVVDASQRVVSARGTVVVGRGTYVVQLKPVQPMFTSGQPLQVDVVTKDHAGHPVQAAVTVELDQDVWNPLERRTTRASRPLASVVATTSALKGESRVTISPAVAKSGYFTLRARSDDPRGNRITAETAVWVFDERVWSYPYRYPSLEALEDRGSYAAGDTARILVNTDVKDAAVLVSVEGRDLHETRVQHLFGNSGLARVPIRAGYAPNVFVALHVRRGNEVHSRVLELKVDAPRHDLAITLTPDRAQYRPQDKGSFMVETRDGAGRPVAAEVALGVVDEAIYSLRADGTPDPHDVFYGRRPNWVTTVVSFPTLYYGGADKGDHGEVRRDFRDVTLWAPTVNTGADGHAEVPVQYPDNLTTWRATARGVSAGTLVGTAVARTLVTKDVVARLAVPRAFTAGDEATLLSVVRNRSGQALTDVGELLEAGGAAKLAGPGRATTSMAADGEASGQWPVAIAAESPRDGSDAQVKLVFRARSKADSDALEQIVPVRPRAVALVLAGSGSLGGAPSASTSVALPGNLVRSGSELTIALASSPAAVALDAVNWLGGYPYGCTEQTANAILPATTLVSAAKRAGRAVPGWDDPVQRLSPIVQHLVALRTPEGGWGWWNNGDADAYFTALAVDALARAAAAGIQPDQALGAIQSAAWTLPRLLADVRSPDGEAYCAAHLSAVTQLFPGDGRFADLRPAIESLAQGVLALRDRLGTSGLACAAVAQQRLGHAAEAKTLLELLLKRAASGPDGLSFRSPQGDPWFSESDEIAGYALSALSAAAPADPRGAQIVRALTRSRRGRRWRNTRVTGVAAVGLADYLAAHPDEFNGASHAKLTWNGETVFDGPLDAGKGFAAGATVKLPGGKLEPGANTLAIERPGTGALSWGWEARANVPSPGPAATDARLGVRREYLRAERTTDRRGRPRWRTSPIDEKSPIRVGESILVRLTLSAPADLGYLLIEDPKPAGFEIEQVLPEGADRPWGTWAEARDDRAVFFVYGLGSGETALEYLLRPEIAGAFTALPPSAGSMYDPDLLVRGGEARLRVVSR